MSNNDYISNAKVKITRCSAEGIEKGKWEKLIESVIKERDEAVISAVTGGGLKLLKAYAKRTTGTVPSNQVLRVAARKMCCEITTMPKQLQDESAQWLMERGYTPYVNWDDDVIRCTNCGRVMTDNEVEHYDCHCEKCEKQLMAEFDAEEEKEAECQQR